ncbi:MAG: hypothetical protein LBS97_06095 [Treponema sp.]|jgi:hypothetical protein|nr:hypothetical protein [Treponema sp.]
MNRATIQVYTVPKIKQASKSAYNATTLAAMRDIEDAIKTGVRGTTDFDAVLAELNQDE